MDTKQHKLLEHQIAGNVLAASMEALRPFVLLKPKIFIDGNKWVALYGENIQDGVSGHGDTPDLAARDFDREWVDRRVS